MPVTPAPLPDAFCLRAWHVDAFNRGEPFLGHTQLRRTGLCEGRDQPVKVSLPHGSPISMGRSQPAGYGFRADQHGLVTNPIYFDTPLLRFVRRGMFALVSHPVPDRLPRTSPVARISTRIR